MCMSIGIVPSSPPVSKPHVPPLQNGDHLTRDEFERRYDAMSGLKRAELIEGKKWRARIHRVAG